MMAKVPTFATSVTLPADVKEELQARKIVFNRLFIDAAIREVRRANILDTDEEVDKLATMFIRAIKPGNVSDQNVADLATEIQLTIEHWIETRWPSNPEYVIPGLESKR